MTWLDRDRMPVRFTVVTSVASGLVLAAVLNVFRSGISQVATLAGKWLGKHLQGLDRPRVLIVASREHCARQQRCEHVLRSGLPDVLITVNDQCAFRRSRAYAAVRAYLQSLGSGRRLDAIFCTNDEMALGAVDALSPSTSATRATVVVGIDGVLEARTLIDSAASPLRATVVQDARRLAGNIVDVLDKMHRGRHVPRRTILPAEIYDLNG